MNLLGWWYVSQVREAKRRGESSCTSYVEVFWLNLGKLGRDCEVEKITHDNLWGEKTHKTVTIS